MERWSGRVVLVTGASAGIGADLTERLVKHGMKVVGCARRVELIQALADKLKDEKGELHAVKCDLRKEAEILNMFTEIKRKYGGVDVCINNAGVVYDETLIDGNTEQWRDTFDINVLALCICTRESIQSMKARGVDDGHIIHISSENENEREGQPKGRVDIMEYMFPLFCKEVSKQPLGLTQSFWEKIGEIWDHMEYNGTAGEYVLGYGNIYCASKFAVSALTEGLRNELRQMNSNIRITAISPGLVKTGIHALVWGDEAAEKIFKERPHMMPNDVSDCVIHALSAPPHVQVHNIIVRPTDGGN